MSQEYIIYTPLADNLSTEQIREAMRARGRPVDWSSTLISEEGRATDWTMGRFHPAGGDTPQVDVTSEAVDEGLRAELAEAYGESLPDAVRRDMQAAHRRYHLALARSRQEGEGLLVNLVDAVAKLTGGLIHELGSRRFYLPDEFEFDHADLLAAGAGEDDE